MTSVLLSKLLASLEPAACIGPTDIEIQGLTWDYTQVRPGWAYFCLEKEEFQEVHLKPHSLHYAKQAMEQGAICLFAEPGKLRDLAPGVTLVELSPLNQTMALIIKDFFGDPLPRCGLLGSREPMAKPPPASY